MFCPPCSRTAGSAWICVQPLFPRYRTVLHQLLSPRNRRTGEGTTKMWTWEGRHCCPGRAWVVTFKRKNLSGYEARLSSMSLREVESRISRAKSALCRSRSKSKFSLLSDPWLVFIAVRVRPYVEYSLYCWCAEYTIFWRAPHGRRRTVHVLIVPEDVLPCEQS